MDETAASLAESPFQGGLHVLRRWNSFTPVLPFPDSGPGGGYFFWWEPHGKARRGIVIDPGFDFLTNFQGTGQPFDAIDAVLLTHSHVDHVRDFESLLTAKYERNDTLKRRGWASFEPRPLDLFLSLDAFHKFAPVIDAQRAETVAKDRIAILTPGTTLDLGDEYGLQIDVLRAGHGSGADPWLQHSVSTIFRLLSDGNQVATVGLTSDARANAAHAAKFAACDLVVGHLGSVSVLQLLAMARLGAPDPLQGVLDWWQSHFEETYKMSERDALRVLTGTDPLGEQTAANLLAEAFRAEASPENNPTGSNHLGFQGVHAVFKHFFSGRSETRSRLAVVSEFGLELGALRHKVADALNEAFFRNKDGNTFARVITGDIGLVIRIGPEDETCERTPENKCNHCGGNAATGGISLKCTKCDAFVPLHCVYDLCIRHRGQAITYHCPSCVEPEFAPREPLIQYLVNRRNGH